ARRHLLQAIEDRGRRLRKETLAGRVAAVELNPTQRGLEDILGGENITGLGNRDRPRNGKEIRNEIRIDRDDALDSAPGLAGEEEFGLASGGWKVGGEILIPQFP